LYGIGKYCSKNNFNNYNLKGLVFDFKSKK
jgi:hypothetical protein